MKIKYILIILLITSNVFAQTEKQTNEYFSGKHLNCETNKEAKKFFDSGIKILKLNNNLNPKFLEGNKQVFLNAIAKDSAFCDAYFFAGYTLRLQNNFRDALVYYYLADSLSSKPSLIYKQNLAMISASVGAVELAKTKYDEIIEHFPESPEGFYGNALISIMINEPKKGMISINKAIELYKKKKLSIGPEVRFAKGILLTQTKEYKKAEKIFSILKSKTGFRRNDNFNAYYSLCLHKIGSDNNNKKLLKLSKKYAKKVKDKAVLKEILKN
ncbi:MAG TPA: hypothetical protein EYG80_01585 [Flavobacteriaceae bacterium]|nr:hypothetical protein [Flavobacteriaceae bacterium]